MAIIVVALLIASSLGIVLSAHWERDGTEDKVVVRFFNVGHGLSILVQTPDGKNILIDAGSFDDFISTVDFLKQLEVPRIDVL